MNHVYYKIKGEVAYLAYFVPIGSRNESKEMKGISHLLEHMLFKATSSRNSKQISYEIEKYGTTLNAFTGNELTCYWVKTNVNYLNEVKKVLEDMVFNSTIPVKELVKEKEVVIQEIQMYNDNPLYQIWEIVSNALYTKDSGLYDPIAGSIDNVKRFTQKDLLSHYYKYKNNITQIQISNSNSCKQIDEKQEFCKLEKITYPNSDYIIKKKGITQTNMLVSGLAHLPLTTDAKFSLQLFKAVLNNMSGRLFSVIREQNNLVYSVYFHYEIFTCGTVQWNVFAALDEKNMYKAKSLIEYELSKPITKQEKIYAGQKLIGQTALILDNPKVIGQRIIYSLLQGLDYTQNITNASCNKNIEKNVKNVNKLLEQIDFKNNRLIAIVPE